MALIVFFIVLLLAAFLILFFRHPRFGRPPQGERLERIRQSPQFREGKFQNEHFTPQLAEGYTISGIIYSQLFKKDKRRKPSSPIPALKTDLHRLPADQDSLVWFGHSSYFIKLGGRNILVDPVFSNNASPIWGTNKPFPGTDVYTAADMPPIDILLITHDHYDHLDYRTIMELKPRVSKVVCGLGVASHLERWGFSPSIISENDWHDGLTIDEGLTVVTLPARHFSGRSFSRNNTLWVSFLLLTPGLRVYVGGDSGYDTHFPEIGKKFGPIDYAILDNGQYNPAWQYIHALPEEVMQAAIDLQARNLVPVHSSKFVMANHPWDEPLRRITELANGTGIKLVTPLIGQTVNLQEKEMTFPHWWEGIK